MDHNGPLTPCNGRADGSERSRSRCPPGSDRSRESSTRRVGVTTAIIARDGRQTNVGFVPVPWRAWDRPLRLSAADRTRHGVAAARNTDMRDSDAATADLRRVGIGVLPGSHAGIIVMRRGPHHDRLTLGPWLAGSSSTGSRNSPSRTGPEASDPSRDGANRSKPNRSSSRPNGPRRGGHDLLPRRGDPIERSAGQSRRRGRPITQIGRGPPTTQTVDGATTLDRRRATGTGPTDKFPLPATAGVVSLALPAPWAWTATP